MMEYTPTNPYSLLQKSIAERVADLSPWGGPQFQTVLIEDTGSPTFEVYKAASRVGLDVLIITPEVAAEEDQAEVVTVELEVIENVVLNRGSQGARVSASDTAWALRWALQGWAPECWSPLWFTSRMLLEKGPVTAYKLSMATTTYFRTPSEAPEEPTPTP